jgi:hypothetical protein
MNQPGSTDLVMQGYTRNIAYLVDELHRLMDEHIEDDELAYRLHDRIGLCEAEIADDTFEHLVQTGSPTLCDDCGMDVLPHDEDGRRTADEWYMVHDDVWAAATTDGGQPRYLCIGCLETRIGRRLTPADFPEGGLNDSERSHSPRLTECLGAE